MKDNTIIDAIAQCCRCNVCGDEVPIPLGVTDWVVGYCNAFVKAHRDCVATQDEKRTWLSKPVAPSKRKYPKGHPKVGVPS